MESLRGFSIVELLVVLGIIAILIAIGFVVLRPNPARHAAVAVASELTAARLRALAGGIPTAVILGPDRRAFERRIGAPWDDATAACAAGAIDHRLDMSRYPRVSIVEGFDAGIVWFPTGWGRTCDGGGVYNGRIVLAGPGKRYAVVVSSAGRVRYEAVQ